MMTRRELLVAPLVGAAPTDVATEIEKLKEEIRKLSRRNDALQERLSDLSQANPPVGTVVAYYGQWPPLRAGGQRWHERDLGWLRCDARTWDQLAKAGIRLEELELLKSILLEEWEGRPLGVPNLQDMFLRGVGEKLDGVTDKPDRNGLRKYGSLQGYATARPKSVAFTTNQAGAFDPANGEGTHLVRQTGKDTVHENTDDSEGEINIRHGDRIRQIPNHGHSIDGGGDSETRPDNIAVHWIIKYK